MTVLYANRGRPGAPALEFPGGNVNSDYSDITISSHLVTGDTIEFMRLPKGALIVGGFFSGESLVTAGTSTGPDIDFGWASNSSALGNLGVLSPAAIAGQKPEVGYFYPLGGLLFSGNAVLDRDQTIIATVNTSYASANFNTATLALRIDWVMRGPR